MSLRTVYKYFPTREQLFQAVANVVRQETGNLTANEQRNAAAVVGYLENMQAWMTLREEAGLDAEQSGLALEWAVRTLIDDLRRRNDAANRDK